MCSIDFVFTSIITLENQNKARTILCRTRDRSAVTFKPFDSHRLRSTISECVFLNHLLLSFEVCARKAARTLSEQLSDNRILSLFAVLVNNYRNCTYTSNCNRIIEFALNAAARIICEKCGLCVKLKKVAIN